MRLESGAHAHAHVIFPVAGRRDRVGTGRVRECFQLGGEGGGSHLRHHQPRMQSAVRRKEGGQATECRVHQSLAPSLADRGQLDESDAQDVSRQRDGGSMKVAAGDDVTFGGEDHRIIGGRVGLDVECPPRKREGVARRAMDLRRAPHRIGVLNTPAVRVPCVDVTPSEQSDKIVRRNALARQAASSMNPRVKRFARSLQAVDAHRR